MTSTASPPYVYLDHFATTPVDPEVLERMLPFFRESYGNPHSMNHRYGWHAAEAVDRARQQIATLLTSKASEILFTSGATESNNLALKGAAALFPPQQSHIISVVTEHSSVLRCLDHLQTQGHRVTLLPVDHNGLIDFDQLQESIRPQTRLISVMFANNEIGVLQPIDAIGKLARQHGIIFHCDATQAIGKVVINVEKSCIDLLTLSGHKIYAPKGIGALYVRNTAGLSNMEPQLHGGGQELGLRSGTLNVPGIVGLGTACSLAGRLLPAETARLRSLRDALQTDLTTSLLNVTINVNIEKRLPNALSISVDEVDGEQLVQNIRQVGLSTGSTCGSLARKTSHVLRAMGISDERAKTTLRLSLGRFTTAEDIEFASFHIVSVINKLREKFKSPFKSSDFST